MRIDTRVWDGADAAALAAGLRATAPDLSGIAADVAGIIARVREAGDPALLELGERFDGARAASLRVPEEALTAAVAEMDPELRAALDVAADNIRSVARAQLDLAPRTAELPQGHHVIVRELPVAAAAIYAPAGRAPYPSSVLMGVIPALEAGVERVVVASPPQADGVPHPAILAAASLAGANEVLAAGGAQAIAALAYGTETIEPVDVIAGPGGPWVQEAKLQVIRRVGIDGYAGPSELMVICDETAVPDWVALDVCAQAEHGADGLLVVVGPDPAVIERIEERVRELAPERPTVADAPLALVQAPDLDAAAALARAIAPEHLQVDCAGADEVAAAIGTAGCIFVGAHGATAFGDYAAGSNHILPTGGAGRFSGPLGPGAFTRKISRVTLDEGSAGALAGTVDAIARAEGFPVHGESARARSAGSGPTEQSS